MTIKAIFCECIESFWIEVAGKLVNEHGFQLCYWTGSINEESVREKFPNAVFHNFFDAIRGIPPYECSTLPLAPIDEALLRDLSFHESIVLKMMDRMDPNDSFYYNERVRLYHNYLKYWIAILDRFMPDIVIFHTPPHAVFNYILYVLCRYRNTKTIMFYPTIMDGIIFPMESFDGEYRVITRYRDLLSNNMPANIEISDGAEKHLKRLRGGYLDHFRAMPEETQDFLTASKKSENDASDILKNILLFCKYPGYFIKFSRFCIGLLRSINRPVKQNYQKQKGNKIEDSNWSDFQYRWYQFQARRKKMKLSSYYHKLTEKLDFKKNYVYVSLHYQPELSTSPMGGEFVHQLLMVELLSKSIPEDWHVIVKENYNQIGPRAHGERSRTKDLYDDLFSISNVKLASLSTPQWDLIDNARAVATVTGTTGWEAVVRGKPVFIFGHAWYKGCEGVFYTPTYEDCKDVLAKIEAGYKVDHEKVRLFVHTLEQVGFRGYTDTNFEKFSGISYEDNISALTKSITEYYYENWSDNSDKNKVSKVI